MAAKYRGIKDPSLRKVKNRGFQPIRYATDLGVFNGWIYKVGRKWNHADFPSLGRVRISQSNMKHVEVLS